MSISYLVSIIIPVYNMENTIGMLLEDIEKQSYKNMEIIIVNDGSTDLSHEIISQYVSRDNRFREILTNQGGVSVARNIGISEARGEYIRFLDADDRLPQDSIYMMVQAMSEENVELVLGGFQTVPDKDSLYVNRSKQGCVPLQEMMLDFAYNPQTFYYGVNWNKLYKREIIESNKILFNSKIGWCEDLLFNLQYYSKCKNVYYIPNNIYIYIYAK